MEESETYPHDTEDVREQLEQQRTLAAQLQEKLEQEELQLASKEQQNELLKSKLSLIKSRSKAKRSAASNDKDEGKAAKELSSSSPKQHDTKLVTRQHASSSVNKGKMNILREQLEQNRIRFERHGLELSEDTRSMEVMVEQLRHELEERDITIQQLQTGRLSPLASVADDLIPEPVDVGAQLLQKDKEIFNLSAQVSNLQNVVLELQENLKEKDCVIEARTQAISLLSEDMSKKWRVNVDMLEETRQQMHIMQENFIRIEAGLNMEIEQLNQQIESNAKKLAQAEDNAKIAEAAHTDLASQNAKLLSELNTLRESSKANSGLEEAKLKVDELSQALSEANKLTMKLKAEHKAKVKALNKQIDSLRKESDLSGELVQLQNHIAELEEEKGNLQLHLIEIEESAANHEQSARALQETVSELQKQKTAAEKNIQELENQLQLYEKTEQEVAELKKKLEDREGEIRILRERLSCAESSQGVEALSDLQRELNATKISLEEWQYRYRQLENEVEERLHNQVDLSQPNIWSSVDDNESEGAVATTETALHREDLILRVKLLEDSMKEKRDQISELEAIVKASLEKVSSSFSGPSPGESCPKCEELSRILIDRESQISALQSSVMVLRQEIGSLKDADALNTSKSSSNASDTERGFIEVSGELELKREECARLESKLKAQVEKAKKLAVNLKVKTVAIKDLEERIIRSEIVLQGHKDEIEKISKEKEDLLEKWQHENTEKDKALIQATEKLVNRESDVHSLSQQLDMKSAIISDLESKLSSFGKQVEDLQSEVSSKCSMIEKLNQDIVECGQQKESGKLDDLQAHLASVQGQLAIESEEKQAAIAKLENFTKQAKLKLAKEKKVRSDLLEKQKELETLVAEKSNALLNLEEQYARISEHFQEEKQRLEGLLQEHQEQVHILHQQLEHERNKLQYASESVSTEEPLEITLELQPLPSYESFQNEIEDICASLSGKQPEEVLPILEEEKTKTMHELSISFESLHDQMIARLQNRPDALGDRKLFHEMRNLVTRVINKTAALENKIKKIVAESNSVIEKRLHDAERSVESLESSLLEARSYLDVKEGEKLNLQDEVNNLSKEKWDLNQQMHEKMQNSLQLETKIKEMHEQINALTQTSISLENAVQEKVSRIQDLQAMYQAVLVQKDEAQQNLQNMYHQYDDLNSSLKKLNEDCEEWKSKFAVAEQEINNKNGELLELQTFKNEAATKSELLQEQLKEVTQLRNEMLSQLEKSSQDIEGLQIKLSDAQHTITILQQEMALKNDSFIQQSASWTQEKEQYDKRVCELTEQLREAEQVSKKQSEVSIYDRSEDVESLQQQLAEKANEIESYQQRLMQLQMGVSNPTSHLQSFPIVDAHVSVPSLTGESSVCLEGVDSYQSTSSNSVLAAFRPAASLFESPSEIHNLQSEIQDLSQHLKVLASEKMDLESEKTKHEAKIVCLNEELNAQGKELETLHSAVNRLELKVSELSAELEASENIIEKEKLKSTQLEASVKELQWKLDSESYEKENAESELKARRQNDAEERPSIPQTLDTHVSSLQDSGVDFRDGKRSNSVEESGNDESLMECNITLLESELGGMVMTRQENALKQANKSKSIVSEVNELQKKISQLEADKSAALSQVSDLQAEIQKLTVKGSESTAIADQASLSVNESLVNDVDSWEWGTESAHLEMQHQEQKSQAQVCSDGSVVELQSKVDLLKSANEALEREKLQLAEDLKASQIRAAKLTRKLKEIKAKYDEVAGKTRSTDSPYDSLDQAIEEERMKQMQSLEKELKDLQAEVGSIKTERDRLQKQVDVFSSANERMVEAKERQDVEVEMWQKRSKDLTNQVQSLEWRIRELEEGHDEKSLQSTQSSSTAEQTSQTPETLNAVEIDQLLKENHTWNANYENLMQEYQKLRAQCLVDSEQRTQIDALVAQQNVSIERLQHEKTYFQDVYDSLKMDYEATCAQLASKQQGLTEDSFVASQKIKELEEKLAFAETQLQETASRLNDVSVEKEELQREIEGLRKNMCVLQEKLERDDKSQLIPVSEEFVTREAAYQGSSSSSTAIDWCTNVSGGRQSSEDIFESIASNTAQGLEKQLSLRENELQKERETIEILKREMEESKQEWGQVIDYNKSQLEASQIKIEELQRHIEFLQHHANTGEGDADLKLDYNVQVDRCHELQNILFNKEKEVESLQINLAVLEEAKRKAEEALQSKESEINKMLIAMSTSSVESSLQGGQASFSNQSTNNLPDSSAISPITSSFDKNFSRELDQALYMLHERDVRCEELTLELTQLLEERDGLQLRLSNAIRTNEELRERLRQVLSSHPELLSQNVSRVSSGLDQSIDSISSETRNMSSALLSESTEGHTVDLQSKLTELRKMGYSHDKSLRDDSEYRHQQQMRLLSPSLPTVLSSNTIELSDAIGTTKIPNSSDASSDSNSGVSTADQSTSNESQGSLLGWLWGRS